MSETKVRYFPQYKEETKPLEGLTTSYITDDEDCMGNEIAPYWRGSCRDSEGKCHIANGATEGIVIHKLRKLVEDRDRFLSMSSMQQLEAIVAKDEMYEDDIKRAIRLLVKELKETRNTTRELRSSYVVEHGYGPGACGGGPR